MPSIPIDGDIQLGGALRAYVERFIVNEGIAHRINLDSPRVGSRRYAVPEVRGALAELDRQAQVNKLLDDQLHGKGKGAV